MPDYAVPGVTATRSRSLLLGICLVVAVLAVSVTVALAAHVDDRAGMRFAIRAEQIGDGITEGSRVRLDGVAVGSVVRVEPARDGTERITIALDRAAPPGLDESLRVDYGPGNLFGISEIELIRGSGGPPLRAGSIVDLTGPRAADVYDATLGSLLRELSRVGDQVLTTRLAGVIGRFSSDLAAFTPLLESLVVLARTLADHQNSPLSTVVGRFGSALDGGAALVDATVRVIDRVDTIDALRAHRAKIDAGIEMVVGQLFPSLETTLSHASGSFAGYTDLAVPVLDVLARMVPDPPRSSAELRTILQRLHTAMPDTPDGPVLNLDVDLSDVPALAVPLLGGAPAGGSR